MVAQSSPWLRMFELQQSFCPSPTSKLAVLHPAPPHCRHPAAQQMSSKASDWMPGTPLSHVAARLIVLCWVGIVVFGAQLGVCQVPFLWGR